MYKKWIDSNVVVIEADLDGDLHQFHVYAAGVYIGSIMPDDVDSCQACRDDLNANGAGAVRCWEDGAGHTVNFDTDSAYFDYWHQDAAHVAAAEALQEVNG